MNTSKMKCTYVVDPPFELHRNLKFRIHYNGELLMEYVSDYFQVFLRVQKLLSGLYE